MKVYLASPFFDEQERENMVKALKILRDKGFEVFAPYEHKVEGGENMPNQIWGAKVFGKDALEILCSDAVVVLNYGLYSDSGTAWECGFAFGADRFVILVNMNSEVVSVMMANGCYTVVQGLEGLAEYDFFAEEIIFCENEQK